MSAIASSSSGATHSADGEMTSGQRVELLVVQARAIIRHPLPCDGTLLIGRASDADVVIDDPAASRKHARIRATGGAMTIEDLDSRNGTRVGAEAATAGRPTPLRLGDTAYIGESLLFLQRASIPDGAGVRPGGGQSRGRAILADAGMRAVYDLVDRVGPSPLSVLILGETGVGKELVAEAVHRASGPRSRKALVRINCAALTAGLVETELFGHERGAFTGAVRDKAGVFEAGEGGTVFLDEIGELPLAAQAKLLRVIETREVIRVGAVHPRRVDVRFVAATNRDLCAEIARGAFREDLYFRLNGFTLKVPPLRERPGEIEPFALHFVSALCEQLGRRALPISEAALNRLCAHAWPGNVRELRNAVECAALRARGRSIEVGDLPSALAETASESRQPAARATHTLLHSAPPVAFSLTETQHAERERILEALSVCHGNQTRAAEWLKMPRRTLVTKLAGLGIPRPRMPRRDGPS